MQKEKTAGRMLEVAGLAAQIILENGAETYRVEDTVMRLCRSYGFENADVLALSTGVIISIGDDAHSGTTIRRVSKRGLDLTKVNAVNELSRRITEVQPPMEEALRALKKIGASDGARLLPTALMAGCAAGSFALMFGGRLVPFAVAFACGFIAQLVGYLFRQASISLVLSSLVGGAVCSGVTAAAFFVLHMTPAQVETTLAGAIMPLISGLMMTNAVRDTLRGDLLSGIARVMEALLVAVMVAVGISLGLRYYLPSSGDVVLLPVPWALAMLYAGVATLFFCPLLRVPGRAMLPASLLGAAAYGAYLWLRAVPQIGDAFALFIASAAVALLCTLLARRTRMIATVFLCAALIPLVPGLGLYRTMRALLLGEYMEAAAIGVQALLSVGAIALGSAIGSLRLQLRVERPGGVKKGKKSGVGGS